MAKERDTSPAVQEKEAAKQPPWWKRFWEWTAFGEKSGWEWLELIVVSLALAVLGVWFTNQQEERQQLTEQQRADAELALEEQRAENAALQAYLDQMSQLMLEEDLRAAEAGSDARMLARARTLTVLSQLEASPSEDETGKEQVVEFLIEAELVHPGAREGPIISLEETDLRGVDLDQEDLHGVNLKNALMRDANLVEANLEGANLESTKLRSANLRGANLYGAVMRDTWLEDAKLEGAIMPNGQEYEEWLKDKEGEGSKSPDSS
jgi:cell division protein FtsB